MGEWRLRPMRVGDEPAVVAIVVAEETSHRGFSDFGPEILADQILAASTVDPERDLAIAEAGGEPIAVACFIRRFALVAIRPEHESPALRAAMIEWTERRQTELGARPFRVSTFASHRPGVTAIRAAGYERERVYARMARTFTDSGPPEAARPRDGYGLATMDREGDAVALYALHERAFAEREESVPLAFEDYVRAHLDYPFYDAGLSRVVRSASGELAGSLIGWRPPDHPHGYVAVLAVDPDHRGHGLGRALLLDGFAAIAAAGLPSAELHVNFSDNPNALNLYRSVGMEPIEQLEHHVRG